MKNYNYEQIEMAAKILKEDKYYLEKKLYEDVDIEKYQEKINQLVDKLDQKGGSTAGILNAFEEILSYIFKNTDFKTQKNEKIIRKTVIEMIENLIETQIDDIFKVRWLK